MKPRILLSISLLFLSYAPLAQNVTYKNDTIYNNDQPYAILRKHGTVVPDFDLTTLDNKEIMMVRFNKGEGGSQQYIVSFIGSGTQTIMKGDIGFGKKLAKEIVENNLVQKSDINPEGEKRFLLVHTPVSAGNQPTPNAAAPPGQVIAPGIIDRDRTQDIFIIGKKIQQSNVIIGNYKKTVVIIDGELYNIYSIYLPNGAMIAEATLKQFNSQVCKLLTVKNNNIKIISLRSDFEPDQVKEIAIYLSSHYYL